MADRVAVMQRGAIVEEGPADAFFGAMRQPYSRALLAASTHAPLRAPPPARPEPLLEVDGLVRDYAAHRVALFRPAALKRAVDGVSFTVGRARASGSSGNPAPASPRSPGQFWPSKPLQGGAIRLAGQEVGALQGEDLRAYRRRVQMVFQDPYGSFDPRHKAGRIVAEPLHLLRRTDRPRRVG